MWINMSVRRKTIFSDVILLLNYFFQHQFVFPGCLLVGLPLQIYVVLIVTAMKCHFISILRFYCQQLFYVFAYQNVAFVCIFIRVLFGFSKCTPCEVHTVVNRYLHEKNGCHRTMLTYKSQ